MKRLVGVFNEWQRDDIERMRLQREKVDRYFIIGGFVIITGLVILAIYLTT